MKTCITFYLLHHYRTGHYSHTRVVDSLAKAARQQKEARANGGCVISIKERMIEITPAEKLSERTVVA